jgi:DnaJ-class molecular chaperone
MALDSYVIKPQTKYSKADIGKVVEIAPASFVDDGARYEPMYKDEFANCSKCHGVDRAGATDPVRGTGMEPCVPCNGTGYTIYNSQTKTKCWLCGGQGEIVCTTCDGQGEVQK